MKSLEIVKSSTASYKKPLFLAGDMNAEPESDFIKELQKDFQILSNPKQSTYPASEPQKTIDYITTLKSNINGFALISAQVLNEPMASDHRPILVEIRTAEKADKIFRTKPYLQNPVGNGITVMWETTVPAYCWVEYGTDTTQLKRARTIVDGQVVCNNYLHKVRIDGLQPGQKYYYRVCSQEMLLYQAYKKVFGNTAQSDFSEFTLPATIIRGKNPGKTVLVTAGLHAGEYVGIQTLIELSKKMNPEKVNGQLVLVKVLNRQDFEKRAGSISWEDGKNLNRVFPGRKDGTKMERLAAAITESLIRKADYYIDLHGGDDYEELTPYVYFAGVAKPEIVEASRKMAEQVDVPYMVQSNVSTGGAYNYAASTFHIPAVLLERGCMGTWEREEVDSMRRDVRNILCSIGAYNGIRSHSTYYPLKMDDVRYQCASVNGLWYPVKKPGDIVHQDEYLGEIRDYEGNVQEICRADMDGVILYQVSSLQVVEGGPVITYGNIVREKDERKTRIAQYWTRRSDSFLEQRRAELHSALAGRWMTELKKHLPEKKNLRILDVGCGTGFFTILLAKEGHQVTGIDLTPDMITHAKKLAEEEKADCQFAVMDAENPDFPDEEFDVIVSRNLTWTLPDAEHAYQEWFRVLKPGGVMINLDANYGAADFADTADLPENHAHHQIQDELMQECEDIKRQLPISSFLRPAWDLETLSPTGVEEFSFDLGISKRIYTEKDEFYNPTPMFLIFAKKQR